MGWATLAGLATAAAFLLSLLVHSIAVRGLDLSESFPATYGLVFMLPLLAVPFVVSARRLKDAGFDVPDAYTRTPFALKLAGAVLIVYAVMTFGLIGSRLVNAHPSLLPSGQPVLAADHGGPVRFTTESVYHAQRAVEMRLLTVVLMIFYLGLGAFFLGVHRLLRGRRAISGVNVSPDG
jgi:hypothetical protein